MKAFLLNSRPSHSLDSGIKQLSRRVRFAVANAIFKLNPTRPFPSSSYVSVAAYFIQTAGTRKAIAADVNPDRSLNGPATITGLV